MKARNAWAVVNNRTETIIDVKFYEFHAQKSCADRNRHFRVGEPNLYSVIPVRIVPRDETDANAAEVKDED